MFKSFAPSFRRTVDPAGARAAKKSRSKGDKTCLFDRRNRVAPASRLAAWYRPGIAFRNEGIGSKRRSAIDRDDPFVARHGVGGTLFRFRTRCLVRSRFRKEKGGIASPGFRMKKLPLQRDDFHRLRPKRGSPVPLFPYVPLEATVGQVGCGDRRQVPLRFEFFKHPVIKMAAGIRWIVPYYICARTVVWSHCILDWISTNTGAGQARDMVRKTSPGQEYSRSASSNHSECLASRENGTKSLCEIARSFCQTPEEYILEPIIAERVEHDSAYRETAYLAKSEINRKRLDKAVEDIGSGKYEARELINGND